MAFQHYRFVNIARPVNYNDPATGDEELCCIVHKDTTLSLCKRYAKGLESVCEPIFETELCRECAVIVLQDQKMREDIFGRVINGDPEDYENPKKPWVSVLDVARSRPAKPIVVVGDLRTDKGI